MAISKEALEKILSGKAAQLCSEEANRKMDTISQKNGGNTTYYNSDYDFDSLYLNEENNRDVAELTVSPQKLANSKLPNSIKEMMTENISEYNNNSVLDNLNIKEKQRRKINENYNTQSVSPIIDYSLIKTIIEECVDRKLNEFIKKQSLNENTLKTIGIAEGKIKLIDNKGNIYQSHLEFHGNIKDKKK